MQISIENLNKINKELFKVFNDEIAIKTWHEKITSKRVVPNSTFTEKWLHSVAGVEEYNTMAQHGKPVANTFGDYASFRVKDFAKILAIKKEDIEDDDLNQHVDVLRDLTQSAIRLPQKLLEEMLNNGETVLAMDGANLFANTHDPGSGLAADNYDNLFAGSGTSLANVQTDIDIVRVAMSEYKAANSVKRGLVADMAVIPAQLDLTFKQILKNAWNPLDDKHTENVFQGLLQKGVEIGTYLDDVNDWYMTASNTATQKSIKWIVKKGYDPAIMVAKTNLTDDNVFYMDEFHWLVETHSAMIAGCPAYIAKIVNT